MFKIIEKNHIAKDFCFLKVQAPLIAEKAQAGNFVIVKALEKSERIPLTLVDFDKTEKTISLVIQKVGKTTKDLCNFKKGDFIQHILGPLGNASEIPENKKTLCIGGGAGIAMVFPLIKSLKQKGNEVYSLLGVKNDKFLILEEECKKFSDKIFITTDDGSKGEKGFVTDKLKELLDNNIKFDEVFAIGPVIMMKNVCAITCPKNIKTTVSLNSIMIDGTGMCGGCRVTVGDKIKFTCVDGPEFNGCEVDFDELENRNKRFINKEKKSWQHNCKLKKINEK